MIEEVEAGTIPETTTFSIPSIGNQANHLQNLLAGYIDLFQEPKGLPPLRSHDHRIPLKEGGNSVNLRPYRYSSFQKDTLEEMVKEMLREKIIRTSNSPFASPIFLSRKRTLHGVYV
jgi:hypothetical protein